MPILIEESKASHMDFDYLMLNGRCIDPETGLNDIRHVAIKEGSIAAILTDKEYQSTAPKAIVIDCNGLVISPGFIDLHSHGAGYATSAKMQAMDGCTFHGELEFGASDVAKWYANREADEDGQIIHYGCTASHPGNRIAVMTGEEHGTDTHLNDPLENVCYCASHDTHHTVASPDQVRKITQRLEKGLREGALGLGLGIQYTDAADNEEVYRIFKLGARLGAPLFIHMRGTFHQLSDFHEMFADSAASSASLHICHINSSTVGLNLPLILEMLDDLTTRGVDITTEAYPYTAGMTALESSIFSKGWDTRMDSSPDQLEWIETGERLTWKTFEEKRKEGGLVAIHNIDPDALDLAIANKHVLIGSDAIPYTKDGKSHPRSAGCFSRVLGRYVRERNFLTLAEAIRKMTLGPALRLEKFAPSFKKKGRLQLGADADITVFDPNTIIDNATFLEPMLPSTGVKYLFVSGIAVIKNGKLTEARPGKGYRSELRKSHVHSSL